MPGVKTENVTSKVVMLGDNHFQSGKITLDPNTTLAAGAILKRAGTDTESFELAAAADDYAAINPFEIKNETSATKVFGFRPLMDGRVRLDMVNIGGVALTGADIDKLRKVGILPLKVTDLSKLDNQ